MDAVQKKLNQKQIEAFYVSHFAADQVQDFRSLVDQKTLTSPDIIVDIGGGCGYFARQLKLETGLKVRVLDTDLQSVAACHKQSIEAVIGDALSPNIQGDEAVICFNLILHHLIADNEESTRSLQKSVLKIWRLKANYVFVNEYVYDSFILNLSGRIIYEITRSKPISKICAVISRFIPSLRANTFGIGVRFRSHAEWESLFKESGFNVISSIKGEAERLSLARRVLLIKEMRRDSFLLSPAS